jgi:hypothetical protein
MGKMTLWVCMNELQPHPQIFVVMFKNKWFSKQLRNHDECLVVKEHQTTIVFLS